MPHKLHIIKANDFVRLDATGEFDLESSHKALASVAKACVDGGADCALLDVRDVHKPLSITDLWTLAATFGEMGFQPSHRLAVLHRLDAMAGANFFAMCASNRGWRVAAFNNFEDVFAWISAASPVGEDGGGEVTRTS